MINRIFRWQSSDDLVAKLSWRITTAREGVGNHLYTSKKLFKIPENARNRGLKYKRTKIQYLEKTK